MGGGSGTGNRLGLFGAAGWGTQRGTSVGGGKRTCAMAGAGNSPSTATADAMIFISVDSLTIGLVCQTTSSRFQARALGSTRTHDTLSKFGVANRDQLPPVP
jgi:hypothetical protein